MAFAGINNMSIHSGCIRRVTRGGQCSGTLRTRRSMHTGPNWVCSMSLARQVHRRAAHAQAAWPWGRGATPAKPPGDAVRRSLRHIADRPPSVRGRSARARDRCPRRRVRKCRLSASAPPELESSIADRKSTLSRGCRARFRRRTADGGGRVRVPSAEAAPQPACARPSGPGRGAVSHTPVPRQPTVLGLAVPSAHCTLHTAHRLVNRGLVPPRPSADRMLSCRYLGAGTRRRRFVANRRHGQARPGNASGAVSVCMAACECEQQRRRRARGDVFRVHGAGARGGRV